MIGVYTTTTTYRCRHSRELCGGSCAYTWDQCRIGSCQPRAVAHTARLQYLTITGHPVRITRRPGDAGRCLALARDRPNSRAPRLRYLKLQTSLKASWLQFCEAVLLRGGQVRAPDGMGVSGCGRNKYVVGPVLRREFGTPGAKPHRRIPFCATLNAQRCRRIALRRADAQNMQREHCDVPLLTVRVLR